MSSQVPSPAPVDEGFLSVLNSALPACQVNNEYAAWAASSKGVKSVPKGAPYGADYMKLSPNSINPPGFAGNQQYDVCAGVSGAAVRFPPADLKNRMDECIRLAGAGSPTTDIRAQSPIENKGLPGWVIIIFAIILLGGISFAMIMFT
jgi:hypothetical protein